MNSPFAGAWRRGWSPSLSDGYADVRAVLGSTHRGRVRRIHVPGQSASNP